LNVYLKISRRNVQQTPVTMTFYLWVLSDFKKMKKRNLTNLRFYNKICLLKVKIYISHHTLIKY